MKKIIKRVLIALGSLLVLLIIAISFALWFVFTPERITPVINKQAQNLLTCEVEIGNVELTFFSTFPQFALKVDDILLINPVENAQSNTLVSVERLIGAIDIVAFWKENKVILSDVSLINGNINAYVDSLGNANFHVFVTDTTETPESEFTLSLIDIGKVELKNINASYIDEVSKINTLIKNLNADIWGTIIDNTINTDIELSGTKISYIDDTFKINTSINNYNGKIKGAIFEDSISADIIFNESIITFEQAGEKYLDNARVKVNLPFQIFQSWQQYNFNKAELSVNELGLLLDGSFGFDSATGDLISNINYDLKKWVIKDIQALVPASFQSYLDGIDTDGLITSSGNISGIFNDSLMPLMDIHLVLGNAYLNYSEILPLPLSGINGDINISTDWINDEISYIRINRLDARTPQSTFETKGTINKLFSDVYSSLTTNANINLSEFNQMLNDSLNAEMKGLVQGYIRSDFSIVQAEKMEIEKMKLSGNLTALDLDVVFDSLWVKTDRSTVDFSLPNNNPESNATFARATVTSDNFETGKLNGYYTFLQNADITVEASDLRDTTRTPDFICSFIIDTLAANIDTISLALKSQIGRLLISPVFDKPDQSEIKLKYNSSGILANAGGNSAIINKINLDTDIVHDKSQSDMVLQWLASGFVDMENAHFTTTTLTHPIEVPSIKMDFNPEQFYIKESRMIIDKSDFELVGMLDNVMSYFRGDSLLRGELLFASNNTDLLQLMALTSGIGVEDDNDKEKPASLDNTENNNIQQKAESKKNDTTFAGPYMVPEGIDFLLTTNIKQASFGTDTAKNVTGDVKIKDGILVLDNLRFTTSAARMQLTTMYRTPRKNHLYLGMDYHMLDVEIERLLEMIPDIDTLMPMLRSFRGKGEFHLAIESYLDSTYAIKKSTLRGASSIRGENLVLLDGETFSEIANRLRFSKQAENRVDSLSAEFTIFREEIDVYPFLIVMDRYRAVVAGRHNFDLSFNYHITIIDSPLPARLGLDINGDMDRLSFRLARTRYPEFYRPASRGAVKSKQLDLRRMIREAITERVEEE